MFEFLFSACDLLRAKLLDFDRVCSGAVDFEELSRLIDERFVAVSH